MTKNKGIVILVILLGSISFWLVINNRNKGTISKEMSDFAYKDTASITKIFLADKQKKNVTLTRVGRAEWMVNGKFPARKDGINTLLKTIEGLLVLMPVAKMAQENILKQMAAGSVKVEIYKGDELVKLYFVGGETQDQLGTFMLMADAETKENSAAPFVMFLGGFDGYLTTRYFTDEDLWRERLVFGNDPVQIRSVKVQFPRKNELSFEISNNGKNVFDVRTLKDGRTMEGFDTLAVKQYLVYYSNIQYEQLFNNIDPARKDSIVASGAEHIITVTDMNGRVNKVSLFRKEHSGRTEESFYAGNTGYDADRMYALINDDKDFSIVQYFVFGKLMPDPAYFKIKAKP